MGAQTALTQRRCHELRAADGERLRTVAPQQLVDRLVESLRGLGRVEVEERVTTSESVQFKLPKEVRMSRRLDGGEPGAEVPARPAPERKR